jgi:hypothetical protein
MTDAGGGPAGPLEILVETDHGTFVRRVRPAAALLGAFSGRDVEDVTRSSAARWGLPDLVFRPGSARRGHGSRELGDAILFAGHQAVSVQIKARMAPSADEARERRWLDKKIAEATRQAEGTIRSLTRHTSVELTNERGHSIAWDPRAVAWTTVVVLDHPGMEGYIPDSPTTVLLRREWDFLFEQLKSTYAVVGYLHRIKGDDPVELGLEAVRYYDLAGADAAAPREPGDPRLSEVYSSSVSLPNLPLEPAGHGEARLHALVRVIQEDLALIEAADPTQRVKMLAAIDGIPVQYRGELASTLLEWFDRAQEVEPGTTRWQFRGMPFTGRPYVLIGVASRPHDEAIGFHFHWFVALRHQQLLERIPERVDVPSVGVLLTPRGDRSRPWDTTCVFTTGLIDFDPEERAQLEELWGPFGSTGEHK